MYGRLQTKTRGQAQREQVFEMAQFSGALNVDKPASKLGLIRPGRRTIYNEVPVLENFIAFPDRLEGRSGSQIFSNTALPGSGTVHAIKQHPVSGKFVLHRGSALWCADNAMASWTQLATVGNTTAVAVVAGDTNNNFVSVSISNATSNNTNAGVLYWNITQTGAIVTLNVYKDSAKSQLVATGAITGTNGTISCTQQNKSGIRISSIINYTVDETSTGQTFTTIYGGDSTAPNIKTYLILFKNDFILTLSVDTFNGGCILYIDLTNICLYSLAAGIGFGYSGIPFNRNGSQSTSTPYGRRYLRTYSRITDTNGHYDTSKNRITGILMFEGPANNYLVSGLSSAPDYAENWFASLPSIANPAVISWAGGYLDFNACVHYTHISIYCTMDIGVNGIDPVTGNGNNSEIYVWLDDIDLTTNSNYNDTTSDDILRSRYASGFGLRTRFWKEMPAGEIGGITGTFLYTAARGMNNIQYCQLDNPINIGYYRPDLQYFKVDDGIQHFFATQDVMVILTTRKTYYSNFKIYTDAGTVSGSVFVMNGPILVSDTIGCNDFGSVAPIDKSGFIAHCSDHSIRIFSGIAWEATDYADQKVSSIIRTILGGAAGGSVGGYFMGHYILWYRTNPADIYNKQCLRLGLGGPSGIGWSTITGASFPFPITFVGALLIIDANGVQRLLVLDYTTSKFLWIETFNANGLVKIFKDAAATDGTGGVSIVPKFRTMEITDPDESDQIYHSEAHCFLRSIQSAFVSGMTLTVNAYVNGGTTAVATINGSTTGGDIQFWERVRGNRIQLEFVFSETGQQVVSMDALYQTHDVKAIGDGPPQTAEASNQTALSANLTQWLCRPRASLNRANLISYTVNGTAPSLVTGPDGNNFALAFPSNTYYTIPDISNYSTFTVMFWIKGSVTGTARTLIFGNSPFKISFPSATLIEFNDNVGAQQAITSFASAWSHFAIVGSAGSISVYQNGVLLNTFGATTPSAAGSVFQIREATGGFSMDDIRAFTVALTTANILFYYNDVINNNGNKFLPQV